MIKLKKNLWAGMPWNFVLEGENPVKMSSHLKPMQWCFHLGIILFGYEPSCTE